MNHGIFGFPSKLLDSNNPNVTQIDITSSYRIPADAKMLSFLVVGAGAGGGAGSQQATSIAATGGGGGSGGGVVLHTMLAQDLGGPNAALYITIGAGGSGGTPGGASSTGGNGSQGGNTTVSIWGNPGTIITALGAPASGVGLGSGGASSGVDPIYPGGYNIPVATISSGGGSSSGGGAGAAGAASLKRYADIGTNGGVGGGGVSAANVAGAGGDLTQGGGQNGLQFPSNTNMLLAGGTVGGGNGKDATLLNPNGYGLQFFPGAGGSGGGGSTTTAGGTGGSGIRGGGGGGGGGSRNGFSAGAGGKGGNGFVAIFVYR